MPHRESSPNLNNTHPQYDAQKKLREKARDLFEGAEHVISLGSKYLIKGESESQQTYNLRLKRAAYDNWPSVAIETRLALSWSTLPIRSDFGPVLDPWIKDVDGCRTSANRFFRDADKNASADGMRFILVDKTNLSAQQRLELEGRGEDPDNLTMERETELGLRPVMVSISQDDVIDWDFDEGDGQLNFVVIKQVRVAPRVPGTALRVIDQRVVWTRKAFQVWEDESQVKGQDAEHVGRDPSKPVVVTDLSGATFKPIIEPSEHPIGQVPLVTFYGIKKATMFGQPVTKDILSHTVSVYNTRSDRDLATHLTNNPQLVVKSATKPTVINAGSFNAIHILPGAQSDADLYFVEPTGSGLKSSREDEQDTITRIRDIMLRQAKPISAQIQSGAALKEESRLFESSLVAHTEEMQSGEIRCWDYMAKWQNDEFSGSVKYNDDFDDSQISPEWTNARTNMVNAGSISRQTQFETAQKDGAISTDRTWAEEFGLIVDETSELTPSITPADEPEPTETDDQDDSSGNEES